MVFQKKKLETPKRIGFRLRETREARGVGLDELALRTKISRRYLEALESCRFADIPYGSTYQKNFIKRYVQALGVSPEPFLEQFIYEEAADKKRSLVPAAPRITAKHLNDLPYLLRSLAIVALFISFALYLGWQVKTIIEPPTLTLYTPNNGQVTSESALAIRGKTEFEAQVSINGQTIHTNRSGEFNETVNLSSGINTIKITAQKKRGKEVSYVRHVILRDAEQFSFAEPSDAGS